jgi:hypothetical protein
MMKRCLSLAVVLAAGCGVDVEQVCKDYCDKSDECSEGFVMENCVDECVEDLEGASNMCQDAMADFTACAVGHSCEDIADADSSVCSSEAVRVYGECDGQIGDSGYEFECADGDTVYVMQVCDGWQDCDDSSDEDVDLCDYEPTWDCGNGTNLHAGQLCDGVDDCGTFVDEAAVLCGPYAACWDDGFDVCDGFNDCGDSSDEDATMCATCYGGPLFPCAGGECVGMDDVCNGFADCADGEDEYGCH